jgi:hypothetical protein
MASKLIETAVRNSKPRDMAAKKTQPMQQHVVRTAADIQEALFQTIEGLQRGTLDPGTATKIASDARKAARILRGANRLTAHTASASVRERRPTHRQ